MHNVVIIPSITCGKLNMIFVKACDIRSCILISDNILHLKIFICFCSLVAEQVKYLGFNLSQIKIWVLVILRKAGICHITSLDHRILLMAGDEGGIPRFPFRAVVYLHWVLIKPLLILTSLWMLMHNLLGLQQLCLEWVLLVLTCLVLGVGLPLYRRQLGLGPQ